VSRQGLPASTLLWRSETHLPHDFGGPESVIRFLYVSCSTDSTQHRSDIQQGNDPDSTPDELANVECCRERDRSCQGKWIPPETRESDSKRKKRILWNGLHPGNVLTTNRPEVSRAGFPNPAFPAVAHLSTAGCLPGRTPKWQLFLLEKSFDRPSRGVKYVVAAGTFLVCICLLFGKTGSEGRSSSTVAVHQRGTSNAQAQRPFGRRVSRV
jgi:hypothetical protein